MDRMFFKNSSRRDLGVTPNRDKIDSKMAIADRGRRCIKPYPLALSNITLERLEELALHSKSSGNKSFVDQDLNDSDESFNLLVELEKELNEPVNPLGLIGRIWWHALQEHKKGTEYNHIGDINEITNYAGILVQYSRYETKTGIPTRVLENIKNRNNSLVKLKNVIDNVFGGNELDGERCSDIENFKGAGDLCNELGLELSFSKPNNALDFLELSAEKRRRKTTFPSSNRGILVHSKFAELINSK